METRSLSVAKAALLENGSDGAFRQLVQDMLAMASRMEKLREKLAAMIGVTGPQYSLLAAIAHLNTIEAAVTVTLLAKHLHVSSTFVTAETGKLANAGLLSKKPNPGDRRSVYLALTAKGKKAMHDLMPVLRTVNDEVFRNLDHRAFAVLCRELRAMVPAIDDALSLIEGMDRGRKAS